MKTKSKALLFAASLFMLSCNNNTLNQDTETAEATLLWSGEYMVDGCGFEVIIQDKRFKPENEDDIDESFKTQDRTQVLVEFTKLEEQLDRRCGLSPESRAMDAIRVHSIKQK